MPRNRYTKELLAPIVAQCESWAQVCTKLDVKPSTGAQTHLTRRAKALGVDASHFVGMCWNKGKVVGPKQELNHYLKKGKVVKSHYLRNRLIKEGIKETKCEHCLRTEWEGNPIPLELDHVNSDHFDNRLVNLQILCPNCHAIKTSVA